MDHSDDIGDCAPDVQNGQFRFLRLYVDELLSHIQCS